MVAVQQLREPLELVEDDQVRLERIDANVCKTAAQIGNRPVAGSGHLLRIVAFPPLEETAEFGEPVDEVPIPTFGPKVVDQLPVHLAEVAPYLFYDASPAIDSRPDLEKVAETLSWLDHFLQEMEQQRPLPADTGRRAQIERRSRREADEVDLVSSESVVARQLQGQERHSRGQLEFLLAEYIQPIDVLTGDRLVRADVEHIDARHAMPEPFDRARDHSSRNHRLSETDLVRHQEAPRGIGIPVKAAHHVVDGPSLKLLERSQCRFRVVPFGVRHGCDLPHPELRETHPITWRSLPAPPRSRRRRRSVRGVP